MLSISKEFILKTAKNSKFCLPIDYYSSENSLYSAVLNSLIESKASELFHDLEVIECCTIEKYPKVVSVENSKIIFIIYDRYMEVVNDIFNYLYESNVEESNSDIEKLVFGLKAENCLLNDDKLGFIYTALNYNSFSDFNFNHLLVKKNSFVASMQVYFLLLHEFAHYSFKSININEFKTSVTITLKTLCDDLLLSLNDDEDLPSIINSMKNLVDNEDLIEECCCDLFAMGFMFRYLQNTINSVEKKIETIKAIMLQLNTLNLLSLVHEKQNPNDFSYFELTTYLRIGSFRAHISNYFDECHVDKLHLTINELFKKFDQFFNTCFLKKFYSIEDEINNLKENISPENIICENYFDLYKGLTWNEIKM